jgi:hypothetical protein
MSGAQKRLELLFLEKGASKKIEQCPKSQLQRSFVVIF